MSISSDGATVRRERILDMLQYVRGFTPRGLSLNQVQLYMSMAHGLTYKTIQQYVYEMQQGGILMFVGGFVQVNQSNFRRLMEVMAPDRDPDTGELRHMMGLPLKPHDVLDAPEEQEESSSIKEEPRKRPRGKGGRFVKGGEV